MSSSQTKGPFRLMTVNTAPERAYKLVGRMIDALKDRYQIEHVGNVISIEQVAQKMNEVEPNVVFSASMWTAEEAKRIAGIAEETKPGVKVVAIPHGMQVEKGPDYVVNYLIDTVPAVLDA